VVDKYSISDEKRLTFLPKICIVSLPPENAGGWNGPKATLYQMDKDYRGQQRKVKHV
jgi:hypothetical protein